MMGTSFWIWSFAIFSMHINLSFSTKIIDCECANSTIAYKEFKLICNNSTKWSTNSYSCYRELFVSGTNRYRFGSVSIGDCRGSTLDPRISNAFKSIDIDTYDITYHGIETLSPNDLQFKTLETFKAAHNNLTMIPIGLFIYAGQLLRIDLSFNQISIVETGAFMELRYLSELQLAHNPIRCLDGMTFLPIALLAFSLQLPWDQMVEFDISNLAIEWDFRYLEFNGTHQFKFLSVEKYTKIQC